MTNVKVRAAFEEDGCRAQTLEDKTKYEDEFR
jgi:hypothetical protein